MNSFPRIYKLLLAYEGTRYAGWQRQSNALAIQEILENVIATVVRSPVSLIGSGRTDAGVHAAGQVAHFSSGHQGEPPLDLRRFVRSCNALLPPDIRILAATEAEPGFHARFSATGKIYHYHLWTERVLQPFVRPFRTHFPRPIDRPLLQLATEQWIGTHDFRAFANDAHQGAAAHDSVRTLRRFDLCEEEGGIRLELEADGFLYQMVRNLVGTLMDLLEDKLQLDDLPRIIESRDRRAAGRAAPPQGLILHRVLYEPTEITNLRPLQN